MTSPARSALFHQLSLAAPPSSKLPTRVPSFIYGCAWKKDETASLVHNALLSGFQGIDVALQPRHYREDLAGEGLRSAIDTGRVKRGDLFVQTKYSPPSAHDPRNVPYDTNASIKEQVEQSIRKSLYHLRTRDGGGNADESYLDSLVLHSPLPTMDQTMEAWTAAEAFVPHSVRHLGISNVTLPILRALWHEAGVKPSVVQNRFHRDTGYDGAIRSFCVEKGMLYQSFWTLTANPGLLKCAPVRKLATQAVVEPEVALYCFVLGLENVVVLNGTTSHMREDHEGVERVRNFLVSLQSGEVKDGHVRGDMTKERGVYVWEDEMKHFRDLIGDSGGDQALDHRGKVMENEVRTMT